MHFDGWKACASLAEVECLSRETRCRAEEGAILEANLDALAWIREISGRLESRLPAGHRLRLHRAEIVRFPAGTLMSYRRHTRVEDVLADPGTRDITAHVAFTALERSDASRGFETCASGIAGANC